MNVTAGVGSAQLASEGSLRPSELQGAVFEASLDPIIVVAAVRDLSGRIVDFTYLDANPAACERNGVTREVLIGRRMLELFPALAGELFDLQRRVVDTGEPMVLDAQMLWSKADGGEARYYDLRAVKVGDGLFCTWRDVSARENKVARVTESERRYRLLAENVADIVLVVKQGVIDWISPSVEREFGCPPTELLGRKALDFIHRDDVSALVKVADIVRVGESETMRARAISPTGVEHWVRAHACAYVEEGGAITGLVASLHVIDDIVEAEIELDRRARFDSLTGLLNRAEILHEVTRITSRTTRSGDMTAVLFCDIDHFKEINDELGHAAGDQVLRSVGERVKAVIRADDFAARIGGDELLVVLPGVHSLIEAQELADKIRRASSFPVALEQGMGVTPHLSIGVTLMRSGETTDELVERADSAMYLAKRAGRNQVVAI